MTERALVMRGASYPVILPSIRDPRLHVASVIITVHVLGQLGLHFRVSVPQILAAILTCFVLEVVITFAQTKTIVWPASAMLTGSGVALIMRVVGTPDDHWTTYAWYVFAAVAGLSLVSKYVLRYRGTPLFNPSNIGLVAAFVLLGSSRVEPLDFWWAPLSGWMAAGYAVILAGGLFVTRRLHLLGLAAAFWITFAAGIAILAFAGRCLTTNWSFAPVCGADLFRVIVTSPELLIFLFFMITDPRTVPAGRVGRVVFGVLVGVASTLLIAPQNDEFGAKVGLLAGLVVMCAARPLLDRIIPAARTVADEWRPFLARRAALVGAAVLVGASVLSGAVAAATTARAVTSAAVLETDVSRIDPASFPPIRVDGAVTDWDPTLDGAAMQAILLTLAQNLEIEDRALLHADASLLQSVDHGDRLAEMQSRIGSAAERTTLAHYHFASVEVSLLRPFGRQDGLSLGLGSSGTVTTETYDAAGQLQSRTTSPFSLTFAVRRATGTRWLTVAVLPRDN